MATIIIIPARMGSSRLPGKPLADIGGRPMIAHVVERAQAAGIGPVVVACAEGQIMQAVMRAGGRAVPTPKDLPSGTDRVWAALSRLDPAGEYDRVVNLQGDLPGIAPQDLETVVRTLDHGADIATLVAEASDPMEAHDPNVVKAAVGLEAGTRIGPALYFSRGAIPHGDGPVYHHIGVYAFRRRALQAFVSLKPSPLEKREGLEQLRALEAGLRIDAACVDRVPVGVDTPEDLERVRAQFLQSSDF